jgi:GT2 family glycosyltransferase
VDISIVLPTYNRSEILRVCLSALAFQTLPADRWEVVVVDDGGSDGAAQLCRESAFPFSLRYQKQENRGAGAARRAGVEAARGEYVLLINDDTIASSTLLAEHLKVHLGNPREKWAVLGNFLPSELCAERALSLWVNTSSFFFPHQTLKSGQLCGAPFFVTCNLSIRRDALLEAGNFDPRFRVAEDTEMGARLVNRGYRVRYHPDARATHEHGRFTLEDLLTRARRYGHADWLLFESHPELLGSGESPFGKLEEADFRRIASLIEEKREAVAAAFSALSALEELDLQPFWSSKAGRESTLEPILNQLTTLVPLVYWHQLLESFLEASRPSRLAIPSSSLTPAMETADPP